MQSEPSVRPLTTRLRPLILVGTAAYWLLMLVLTHLPEIPKEYDSGLGDKSEHLIGYMLLSVGLGLCLSVCRGPLGWRQLAMIIGIVGIYGAFDECTQPLFGRNCDWYDWLADLRGCLMGVLAVLGIDQLCRRWRPEWFPPSTTSLTP
jgi:VanZ family protein